MPRSRLLRDVIPDRIPVTARTPSLASIASIFGIQQQPWTARDLLYSLIVVVDIGPGRVAPTNSTPVHQSVALSFQLNLNFSFSFFDLYLDIHTDSNLPAFLAYPYRYKFT